MPAPRYLLVDQLTLKGSAIDELRARMKAYPRFYQDSGQLQFPAGAIVLAHWFWTLWVGVQTWSGREREPMPRLTFWRYLVAPLTPLAIATMGSFILAVRPHSQFPNRLLAPLTIVSSLCALLTPTYLGHDLGLFVLLECFDRLGGIHFERCIVLAALGLSGLGLFERYHKLFRGKCGPANASQPSSPDEIPKSGEDASRRQPLRYE